MTYRIRFSPALKCVLLGAMVLVLAGYYPWSKAHSAYERVRSFSELVVNGMPVQGLEEKAGELGLNVLSLNRPPSGKIVIWSGWLFAKWYCEIEHEDGKCIRKEMKMSF